MPTATYRNLQADLAMLAEAAGGSDCAIAQVSGLAESVAQALDLLHGPGNDHTHHLKAMVAEALSLAHDGEVSGTILIRMAALMESAAASKA